MTSDISRYLNRIEILSSRTSSGCYDLLSDRQKYLYAVLKNMGGKGNRIQRHAIPAACDDPSFVVEARHNVVTDFCYNKVNREDNENKFLRSLSTGVFQFVDFNWQHGQSEPVTWEVKPLKKSFIVGEYKDSEFQWDFDELTQALRNYSLS